MSTAVNHRKRSHRSDALHRKEQTRRQIYAINKKNSRPSFFGRAVRIAKKMAGVEDRKDRPENESDN